MYISIYNIDKENVLACYYNILSNNKEPRLLTEATINRIEQEYFTALYKKYNGTKRMTYDMDFNMYLNPLPCTLNEAMRRQLSNEILLNDIIV